MIRHFLADDDLTPGEQAGVQLTLSAPAARISRRIGATSAARSRLRDVASPRCRLSASGRGGIATEASDRTATGLTCRSAVKRA